MECPLLQEVKKILLHRLRNMLSWSHFLRNSLWNLMASSFPETIAPIGKVTASVDEAVQELGKLWPIQVIVNTVCSEPECGKNLGKFSCVFDYILTLSSPLKGPLKDTNYSLCDLIVDRISHYVKNILRHKIRCIYCGGFPQHTGVALSNLKIPSFLFLNFILVEGGSNNMFNDFKDSCLLEPYLQLESLNLELLSAVMSSQMHFFTISKLFGSFYKFDNMIVNACAHPFSSFEEAYCQKSKQKAAPFYLNRRSVRPKKGAVYFVVYKGQEYDPEVEVDWIKKQKETICLDNLPNWKATDQDENDNIEIVEIEATEQDDGDNIEPASIKATEQDENVNIVGNKATEQDDGDNIEPASEQDENDDIQSKVKEATQQDGKAAKRRKLITGEAKLLNDSCDEKGSDENANSNTKNTESTDVPIFSDDDLDPSMFADSGVNNSLHLETSDCSDDKIEPAGSDEGSELEVDSDAGSVLEADSSEEEADGDPGSNLDEASDEESENDKFLSMESHVSKCKVDYRLQTLQDLGRYQGPDCLTRP
jgi:hypothetical protein